MAAAVIDVQADIDSERHEKSNKYHYKANMNELIGILKDRLVLPLTLDDTDEQFAMIKSILDEIKYNVVPIRKGRSVYRNPSPRDVKFHHNQKVNC